VILPLFLYMKDLNLYITEKLKIDKDTQIPEYNDTTHKIADLLELHFVKNEPYYKEEYDLIEEWVNSRNVVDFKAFGDHDSLWNAGVSDDIIEKYKDVRKNFIPRLEKNLRGKPETIIKTIKKKDWRTVFELINDVLIIIDYRDGANEKDWYYKMFKKEA